MAGKSNNTKNNSRGNGRAASSGNGRGKSNSSPKRVSKSEPEYIEEPVFGPLSGLLIALGVGILIFLCNINILGSFGEVVSKVTFGILGVMSYVFPFFLVAVTYAGIRIYDPVGIRYRRVICGSILYAVISMLTELVSGASKTMDSYILKEIWDCGSSDRLGGGVIFGSIAYFLKKYLSNVGTVIVLIIIAILCIVLILGKDALNSIRDNGARFRDASVEAVRAGNRHIRDNEENNSDIFDDDMPRYAKKRKGIGVGMGSGSDEADDDKRDENLRDDTEREDRIQGEPLPEINYKKRIDKKVSGTMEHTRFDSADKGKLSTFDRDDIHEITVKDIAQDDVVVSRAHARSKDVFEGMSEVTFGQGGIVSNVDEDVPVMVDKPSIDTSVNAPVKPVAAKRSSADRTAGSERVTSPKELSEPVFKAPTRHVSKAYKMPPLSLLNKFDSGKGSSKNELMDKAVLLKNTLENFGVKAEIKDISQGPSVTRFELQPEVGVRVNKIVSLADDIKLSLAATDIRIEAPIPGKSAVGIEVPNKESTGVGLRELLEDKAFKDFDSKLAFAVGKDIAGQTIVADIAKMPHMLIAGATGSGKSVCINTIIMSILYKAHPDDVKLIMVDPKVVELSVYNGIPHLMTPVVTDPKKAAAALNWGVAEMTERYKKFADMNVRDLKGYNKIIEGMIASGKTTDDEGNEIHKLPQIVIIVDELADLMMVAAKEVEESICRIAQLARACGIHLIIATQRPSVDVITGLIKANMPSRVAFAVSSGVDSRTILDMNGAEKLLGKGDMLFFPQGYPKPARVQGAFVSDAEVGKVVDYLKSQDYVGISVADIENKISNISISGGSGDAGGSADETDDLFAEAGKFIIMQDKASIGSLQRKFKIGFNRAARIMDQLAEAGVVSEENGTKPREILMSIEQFEEYVDEI